MIGLLNIPLTARVVARAVMRLRSLLGRYLGVPEAGVATTLVRPPLLRLEPRKLAERRSMQPQQSDPTGYVGSNGRLGGGRRRCSPTPDRARAARRCCRA